MTIDERVKALVKLGFRFQELLENKGKEEEKNAFESLLTKARQKNAWFTEDQAKHAFSAWAKALQEDKINHWIKPYLDRLGKAGKSKTIGVINAGNIPLVGLHDLLCVVMSGHDYLGKNSSDDPYLLPFLSDMLIGIEPGFSGKISFTEKLSGFDAVIATGSNNSARYFDYYFGKYPHVIRKNRNAVAVITEGEREEDFKNLGTDVFQYFGLGCRNVSKLFVPRDYSFNRFFESVESFSWIAQHHKYMNNHDYNNAMYLLKKIPFLDNGFLLIKEDEAIPSPISVLHYEYYDDEKSLENKLEQAKEKIQCVVGTKGSINVRVNVEFGKAQFPELTDYADGVDTMEFFLGL